MANKQSELKAFGKLKDEDKDLTMFTITNLTMYRQKKRNVVSMALKLKRKVSTELLTTYLPTILLLIITLTTIFFDEDLFGDAIAVNLTIMLVMTTIFTSKIEELPPTSDMKMIDIWLIFCLVVPFLEVVLRTAIECLNCECQICEPKEPKNMQAWAITGNKVNLQSFCVTTKFMSSLLPLCFRKWKKVHMTRTKEGTFLLLEESAIYG